MSNRHCSPVQRVGTALACIWFVIVCARVCTCVCECVCVCVCVIRREERACERTPFKSYHQNQGGLQRQSSATSENEAKQTSCVAISCEASRVDQRVMDHLQVHMCAQAACAPFFYKRHSTALVFALISTRLRVRCALAQRRKEACRARTPTRGHAHHVAVVTLLRDLAIAVAATRQHLHIRNVRSGQTSSLMAAFELNVHSTTTDLIRKTKNMTRD